jgi:hypothetical protein
LTPDLRWSIRSFAVTWSILLAVAAHSPSVPADKEIEPLALEDVVRLYVSGTPAEELIDLIRVSQVDFDLSEEMLQELELAGLPPPLIQAMVDRQRELHPPPLSPEEPSEEETAAGAGLTIGIELRGSGKKKNDEDDDADDDAAASLRVLNAVHPDLLEQLRVRDDRAGITDVAIYVACLTATHVPDHWRSESPLGRDFNSMPRHKLLAFFPGATEDGQAAAEGGALQKLLGGSNRPSTEGLAVLKLDIPNEIELQIDSAEAHDLSLGFAVQIDGRFYRVDSDEWKKLVPEKHDGAIRAEIIEAKELDPWSIDIRLLR